MSSGAAATANVITNNHKDGISALQVNVTSTAAGTDVSLTHKAVETMVGKTYLVRFWATAAKNSSKMALYVKGNSKTLTYNYKIYNGWTEYQFAFKAFEPSVNLSLLFQKNTEFTIDKVELLDENNTEVDVPMNYMWQNNRPQNEYGWLTADGQLSQQLPDGRVVWTFSDGWYGYNDTTSNSMNTNRLLRNTLVVQSAPRPDGKLHTIIGGTVANPEALMNPPDNRGHDNFFWPRDMIVENDSLKVFSPEVLQVNENDPLVGGKREAISVFSLPDLKLDHTEWLPFLDSLPEYDPLCAADDGYTYAYSSYEGTSNTIVARYPSGHLAASTPWQFFSDTGWSSNYKDSKAVFDQKIWDVVRLGPNNYAGILEASFVVDKVMVTYAQSPTGPWTKPGIVGQITGQEGMVTYMAVAQEETAKDGIYTVGYSNNGDIGRMLDDKTVYWPTYLKCDLKGLSPFTDSTLPVKLLEFTAKPAGEKVLLQWKTATETNNDHFEIERSADGKSGWTSVASVKSKGNSLQAQSYNTYDAQPLNGSNYYRLKQVDVDGKASYSLIQLVNMKFIKAVIKAYPNPSRGDVYVQLENYAGNTIHVQFSTINGKQIFNKDVQVQSTGSYKIPFNSKPAAGVYNMVVTGTDLNQTIKLVIQ